MLDQPAALLEAVDVIPAVGMENIRHQGRAQHVSHLAARHSGLELGDHVLSDDVALLDIDPVRGHRWNERQDAALAARDEQRGNEDG